MISYQVISHQYPGFNGTEAFLAQWIDRYACKEILEVGAGANPALSPSYVHDSGLSYTISDINPAELAKASVEFKQLVLDVEHAEVVKKLTGSYDCIFSKLMGEHITNAEHFHRNINTML